MMKYDLTEDDMINTLKQKPELIKSNDRSIVMMTPLTRAVAMGWKNAVIFLLQNDVDIDKYDDVNNTPLTTSVIFDRFELFELLLQNGADVSVCNHQVFFTAVHSTKMSYIKYLVNDSNIEIAMEKAILRYELIPFDTDRRIVSRFLHTKRLLIATMVLDLPQYIILWITDWLSGSQYLTEFEKIQYIEAIQRSIKRLKNNSPELVYQNTDK